MEQQLKQRLLGATVIVSLGVIFLPIIFDGDGYRQLSDVELEIPEQPRISFEQNFPELSRHDSRVVVTREQVNVGDLSSAKRWFVHVTDYDTMDSAAGLVKRLSDGGYKASYRVVSKGGGKTFKVEVNAGGNKAGAQGIAERIKENYGFKTSLARR